MPILQHDVDPSDPLTGRELRLGKLTVYGPKRVPIDRHLWPQQAVFDSSLSGSCDIFATLEDIQACITDRQLSFPTLRVVVCPTNTDETYPLLVLEWHTPASAWQKHLLEAYFSKLSEDKEKQELAQLRRLMEKYKDRL